MQVVYEISYHSDHRFLIPLHEQPKRLSVPLQHSPDDG